jgi:hypothetical protein
MTSEVPVAITHPPAIGNYEIVHSTRLRFVVNAALLELAITYQNLLDLILFVTGATAPYDLFTSVKVRSVEMWAAPLLGSAVTTTVRFVGETAGSIGSLRTVTDTSMGIEPAHVKARPGAQTLASMFQISSGAVAFDLTCPSGTVVDVELSYKNLPGTALAAQNVSAGATVGIVAYRGLDGLAIASSKFVTAVLPQI